MKTIFVTFPFGIAARNMICARVIEKLRENGFRVVVIAPQKSHTLLRGRYPDEGVILESYPKYESFFRGGVNIGAGLLEKMVMGLINASLDTDAIRYRRYEQWLRKRYFTFFRRWFFQSIFAGKYRWSEYFRAIDAKYFPDERLGELFSKYHPVAVFSPHVQFDFNLIKRARTEGVPSFGQVLSIDNLTTKGNIRAKSDYLFVWNEVMKKEAVEYNLYKLERVIPVGIPQYDLYHDKTFLLPREDFCAQIGADPAKAIFVYASEAGDSPDDGELIDFLLESQKLNRFVKPFTLVARTHPRDTTKPFEKFKNNSNVIVDDPHLDEDPFIDHWYPSLENIKFFVNLMYHSSLILMMGSTLGLDAVGFDKPVISLGFDLLPKPYYSSVRRYYDNFSHQRLWFDTGAFKIAISRDNLIKEINRYLEHPEYETKERKQLIDKLFYKFDGRVGDRIVESIIFRI